MLYRTESAMLRVIRIWREQYGRTPSVKELSESTGKEAQLVRHYLRRLKEKGYIELTRVQRSLQIVPLYWE